jgi:hypothetical protein
MRCGIYPRVSTAERSRVINIGRNWPLSPLDLAAFFLVWSAQGTNVWDVARTNKKAPDNLSGVIGCINRGTSTGRGPMLTLSK